jgi:hypothetical protein
MRCIVGQHNSRGVVKGIAGAGVIAAALLTPFLRRGRLVWGAGAATADCSFPGDDLVARPRWAWTHAIDIDASAEAVWPWAAMTSCARSWASSWRALCSSVLCSATRRSALHLMASSTPTQAATAGCMSRSLMDACAKTTHT